MCDDNAMRQCCINATLTLHVVAHLHLSSLAVKGKSRLDIQPGRSELKASSAIGSLATSSLQALSVAALAAGFHEAMAKERSRVPWRSEQLKRANMT